MLEALPLPSLPFMIADKLAAQGGGELSPSDSPPASAATVLQVLRELEKDHLVKGYTLRQWEGLGVRMRDAERVVLDMPDPQEPAHLTTFWWSVNNWRDAQATAIRQGREADRRKAASQAAEQARRRSPVRDAVDSVLKERERLYKSRTPFDGPQGG